MPKHMNMPPALSYCYIAAKGFEAELREEILRAGGSVLFERGRLFGANCHLTQPVWADNTWLSPQYIPIASIADGAKQLRGLQRNWALLPTQHHRRAALIAEQLPSFTPRPHVFGQALPVAPVGGWTLWDRDCLLASALCSSPFVHGAYVFAEDKEIPPNRAYLKLWEVFTRLQITPGAGDVCLDLGSAPGGWSWVLATLGARVFSVDKAALAPHIARMPLVEHCQGSAFALEPAIVGQVNWLFSDVACYPERLLRMVRTFSDADPELSLICTIKLAGSTDFAAIEAFSAIEHSQVMHLYNNKHELTWIRLGRHLRGV